jgi:DNA polymerase II small subunit/DNA polymerase delta subunit B
MIGKGLMNQLGITESLIEESDKNEVIDHDNKDSNSSAVEKEEVKETQNNEDKITTDQLKKIEEQFSTLDKTKVLRLLTSKFSMEEIKNLSTLTSGGVSQEELQDLKKLLKERMSLEEINYLKGLYEEYY